MVSRMILNRSQRWWLFVGVALLVHGALVVAVTYREVVERSERHLTRATGNLIWDLNHASLHRPSSDPAIRLGINVEVFTLTQESSLARR